MYRVSSSESVTPAPASAPARATRANVTLPPGYIWGVTIQIAQTRLLDGLAVRFLDLRTLIFFRQFLCLFPPKPTPPPAAPPPEESPRAETPKDDVLDLQAASILPPSA
jgi:hypothetical protein